QGMPLSSITVRSWGPRAGVIGTSAISTATTTARQGKEYFMSCEPHGCPEAAQSRWLAVRVQSPAGQRTSCSQDNVAGPLYKQKKVVDSGAPVSSQWATLAGIPATAIASCAPSGIGIRVLALKVRDAAPARSRIFAGHTASLVARDLPPHDRSVGG